MSALRRIRRSAAWWWPLVRLAPGPFWRARFALARSGRPTLVRLRSGEVELDFEVAGVGDLIGLREVFVEREYELELPRAPERVVDLGANIGAATLRFAARWPAAEILALEPEPRTFARLTRNTAPYPRITAERLAAAGRAGELVVRRGADSLSSSTLPHAGDRGSPVRALTLDDIVERCGGRIDLLKFDIEGAEAELLRSARRLESVSALVGELHEDITGVPGGELAGLLPHSRVELEPLPKPGRALLRAWL